VARTADRSITFDNFQTELSSHKGKTVIFGGVIVQARNVKTGTLIEIDQKELDYWGKPRRTGRSGGRFIVLQPRHLDILVYAPGREITVAGEVAGTEEATYPLINAREIKLWPREKPAREHPTFLDPLNDPGTPQSKYGY
jgi:outer membrane lipoprotein